MLNASLDKQLDCGKEEQKMNSELTSDSTSSVNAGINKQLNDIGWGLLFLLTGIVWLVPGERVPEGTWLFGVATILLGLNVFRFVKHMKVDGFSVVLGLAALVAGLTPNWLSSLPLIAICFIVIGATLIAKPLLHRRV
jgi:hypothetical protein